MSGQEPQPLSWMVNAPIVDKSGNMSRPGIIYFQNTEKKIAQSLTRLGLNSNTVIDGTSTTMGAVHSKTQNLTTNGQLPTSSLTGTIPSSQVTGFTLQNVPDGSTRFAVDNGANLNGVALVDAANLALINFADTNHQNKILDNISDGTQYQRFTRVAKGATALPTGLLAGGTNAVTTVSATGVLSTDAVEWSYQTAPAAQYLNGSITVLVYVTTNNVNIVQINPTAGNVTPGATTVNWVVIR